MQSYFAVSKDIRLNSTHYSITEIQNKRKFQQTAINHLSGLEFNDFMKINKKYTAKTIFNIHKKILCILEKIIQKEFIMNHGNGKKY